MNGRCGEPDTVPSWRHTKAARAEEIPRLVVVIPRVPESGVHDIDPDGLFRRTLRCTMGCLTAFELNFPSSRLRDVGGTKPQTNQAKWINCECNAYGVWRRLGIGAEESSH